MRKMSESEREELHAFAADEYVADVYAGPGLLAGGVAL